MAIIGQIRFSFVKVWEPSAMMEGQAPKYSTQVLIEKSNAKLIGEINKMIDTAIEAGVSKGLFTKAQATGSRFKRPLRDGDKEYADDPSPSRETAKGCMFFNASAPASQPPHVLNQMAKPIMDRDQFYSGCYGYLDVNFYPYNRSGSMGIAAGLNSVMKKKDGDRLDGRPTEEMAAAAFAAYTDNGDDDDDGQLM